ncbi:MAG: alpha-amylase family glycosyl hydrolase [Acidimicrobiales bacterium]|nr:alpha-amylase family glycosyl hydrolase [Acidimicrobiales bacterium]
MNSAQPWWKSCVAYQIYPRSFCDTTGNGVGDLEGIRRHLDYLAWLGVDALWLSPFYKSPMADYGYDVADYCDVDPLFGTLDDFDKLLADAHRRNLRVIIDWVPNHTSDQHPWFIESRSSRDNPKRNWYWWRDPKGDGPPNNWIASFTFGPAWEFDESTQQYYLHTFLPQQPDLNWHNPEVVAAMHETLHFWLDRGVDGFRMDVIHLIGKDPELGDDPPDLAPLSHVPLNHRPETHELLRDIRLLLDSYDRDRMAVGEVYLLDTSLVATYYGHGDELHLNFNFPPLYTPWDAALWRQQIEKAEQELGPIDAWPTWVLSNHDNKRHRTRYGGSESRARAAAVLLLTLRGTPFLYAGEELGLEDCVVPPERVLDPGGRDGCRAPIPWDGSPSHGWASADPWLPWPPEPDKRNVADLTEDPESILHLYRRLIAARKASAALAVGSIELLDGPDVVLAYRRYAPGDNDRFVLINFSQAPTSAPVDLTGPAVVEIASDGEGEGAPFTGVLAPEQAVVLRRC